MDGPGSGGEVERLRNGDATALVEVYQAWRPRLYSFLVRMTGRRDEAEDLLQEVFLRLATHGRDLVPDTRIDAWLFTVGRNLVVSTWRRRREVLESDPERADPAARSPFEEVAASEEQRRLEQSLAGLPLPLREAILLVAVEGLAPAEAARILGLTPEAVRQRVLRARDLLIRRMRGEERT